jgi:hypothetical protein
MINVKPLPHSRLQFLQIICGLVAMALCACFDLLGTSGLCFADLSHAELCLLC